MVADLGKISLNEKEKDIYLKEFLKQMKVWEITMPPVEPLLLHFGLYDFKNIGLIEYWIATK